MRTMGLLSATAETKHLPLRFTPGPQRPALNVGRLERDHERGQRDVVTTSIVVERPSRLRQMLHMCNI
jgi:hypothetical protein